MLRLLVHARVPQAMVLFARTLLAALPLPQDVDFLETFAGEREVTKAWLRAGKRAVACEIKDHPERCNFVGPQGWATVVYLALRTRPAGGFLAAPVCSTWVWMNRATARRSVLFPLGDQRRQQNRDANKMISNLTLLLYLLTARGVMWVVEQPSSSLMEAHPRWQTLCERMPIYKIGIWMSDFGGSTPKRTVLYSQVPWIPELCQYRLKDTRGVVSGRPDMVTSHTTAAGRKHITGIKSQLKNSQTYPRGFGEALHKLHQAHEGELRRHAHAHKRAAAAITPEDVENYCARPLSKHGRWDDSSVWESMRFLPS